MAKIKLTQGKYAVVDKEDFEWLNSLKWQYDVHGYATRGYWIKGGKGKTIKTYLHRFVMGNPKNKRIDHINRNKLDCRKVNLRIATHSENLMNRVAPKGNKSGYKGVIFDKSRKKWRAEIKHLYKSYYLGRFITRKEAALAYNQAAKEYFGEFAYQNQIGGNI